MRRSWVQRQIHHFRKAKLRRWHVHPAIGTRDIRRWMAEVPSDTPSLSVRAAYALIRLYHLEGYSAENSVLLASCVRTARVRGWHKVCELVGVPADESQWPVYRFLGQAAVSAYFEAAFDTQTGPLLGEEGDSEWCRHVFDQQCQDHEPFDLERVFAVSGVTQSIPR